MSLCCFPRVATGERMQSRALLAARVQGGDPSAAARAFRCCFLSCLWYHTAVKPDWSLWSRWNLVLLDVCWRPNNWRCLRDEADCLAGEHGSVTVRCSGICSGAGAVLGVSVEAFPVAFCEGGDDEGAALASFSTFATFGGASEAGADKARERTAAGG